MCVEVLSQGTLQSAVAVSARTQDGSAMGKSFCYNVYISYSIREAVGANSSFMTTRL